METKLVAFLTILSWSAAWVSGYSDFVESVDCEADRMRVQLKATLPTPRSGMWDLEVENYPDCPSVTKVDVGGGHVFEIPFAERELCGVNAEYILTPKRLAQAKTVLLLKDDNGTIIADSVSCVYRTKFHTSLLTYNGEVRSENLVYGGSLEEDGSDIEATVRSSESVDMDFFRPDGTPLPQRNVKLGDMILFRIDVSKSKQVSRVLPENCYFSSSTVPSDDSGSPGSGSSSISGRTKTLPFIRGGCFNERDGMVRAFLPKMERTANGTMYEMAFPAFYFTGHGQNLFVHCTLFACVGENEELCQPKRDDCFAGTRRRRKRQIPAVDNSDSSEGSEEEPKVPSNRGGMMDEVAITKYIVVQKDSSNEIGADLVAKTEAQSSMNDKSSMNGCERCGSCVRLYRNLFYVTICSLVGINVALLLCYFCAADAKYRSQRKRESSTASNSILHQSNFPPNQHPTLAAVRYTLGGGGGDPYNQYQAWNGPYDNAGGSVMHGWNGPSSMLHKELEMYASQQCLTNHPPPSYITNNSQNHPARPTPTPTTTSF